MDGGTEERMDQWCGGNLLLHTIRGIGGGKNQRTKDGQWRRAEATQGTGRRQSAHYLNSRPKDSRLRNSEASHRFRDPKLSQGSEIYISKE